MIPDRISRDPDHEPGLDPAPRRLFIREPGWRVGHKLGSEREFCYMQAPGEDFYHRIMDGELYLVSGEERICVPCAARRGLFHFEPRALRQPVVSHDVTTPDDSSEYEIRA